MPASRVAFFPLIFSVFAGFAAVLLLGALLHLLGQDSRQWWYLLLPVWVAVALLLYFKFPWTWAGEKLK